MKLLGGLLPIVLMCWGSGNLYAQRLGSVEELPAPQQQAAPIAGSCTSRPLSLSDFESLALANNPTLTEAAADVQLVQGAMLQAGLYPNPTLGYLRTDADQPGKTGTNGVFFSQDIVTAGKLRLAQSAAGMEVASSEQQREAQRMRVLNDVRIRFYEVLGAQEAVKTATELEGLAVDGLRLAEKLLQAKQGTRLDVVQAEIQLSAVRTALQEAKYREQSSLQQLLAIAGVPDMHPVTPVGTLESDIPQLEWHESLRQLLAASPLLQSLSAKIDASQYDLQLARAQAVPNVNVQVVAERDHVQKFSSVSTLLSVPLPILNRNQGNIRSAEARVIVQKSEYDRTRLVLIDQLASAFRQYRTLLSQTERLQKEILPRTKENLDLTNQAYKQGQFDFQRVVNARQLYSQTRLGYIDALTELHKMGIEIQGLQLTGGLNPSEAGTALQGVPGAGVGGTRSILLQRLQQDRGGASRILPGAIQSGN